MSQLESQRKEAEDIVYRWFRFRIRRGLGVFYALLASLSLLGSILGTVFASQTLTIVCDTIALLLIWAAARAAGFRGFGRMGSTIDLLKEGGSTDGRSRSLRAAAIFVVVAVWPWVAFAAAAVLGQTSLEVLFALVWLVEFVGYSILSLRRNKNPMVDHRLEDWLVVVCIPTAALVSALRIFHTTDLFFGFDLVSPLLLFSGIKSLYDAPKELARDLGGEPG